MTNQPAKIREPQKRRPLHELLNLCGVVILVVGLASAALVYVFAGDDREAEAAREIASGRMYEHNLELMGGKLNVLLVQFNEWFSSLWHGAALAATLAVLSLLVSLVCFWVAHLIETSPRDP